MHLSWYSLIFLTLASENTWNRLSISVIAEFNIDKKHLAYKKISENGLEDQESIILRRVLSKEGVSKAFINDSPVTATFLQEIGSLLVEIHGQNEKIGLLDSSNHIKILDKYGVDDEVLLKVEKTYDNYKKLSYIYNALFDIEQYTTSRKHKPNRRRVSSAFEEKKPYVTIRENISSYKWFK